VNIEPEPDTKDWTWVLRERCPECGFSAAETRREDLARLTADVTARWVAAMELVADARRRPAPAVWSPLEYACHVRDVFGLATYRVGLMRNEDGPRFANWDQDATALEDDYASQDPSAVVVQLGEAGSGFAAAVAAVPDEDWDRTGLRGDGAEFTVESFTRYLLHDPIHHLTDVTGERWAD
jgi:hypothetical protein